MCGIAGIFDRRSSTLETDILKMRDTFIYRGPDGAGHVVFQEAGVALGHRRLSILDLSDAGSQPMVDESGLLFIVHNGEVYNFIELRRELEGFGYNFRSNTDTEVILAAYNKWGKDCLKRFNGMFAFAIWDTRTKHLFLARDRLGIKPLYYYWNGKRLLFASEVKSILQGLRRLPQLHCSLIDSYMSFGYIPGEDTLFQGIKRLLPGHYIICNGETFIDNEYWDLDFHNQQDLGLDYYIDRLKTLLNSSIDLRLRSDVPLGIFLSGGIDSSAVVALLAPRVNERLKTYSVAYDFGAEFNETNYARLVARQFDTDHHEYFITPGEFRDFIPEYVYYMDEPVTESAAISLYYIAKKAKEDVTVILSGEGSDEIFAGYDFYFYNSIIERYRKIMRNQGVLHTIRFLCSFLPNDKIKKYLQMSLLSLERRYKGISTYEEMGKTALYNPEFKKHLLTEKNHAIDKFLEHLFAKTKDNDHLSKMLFFDTKTWLVDDLLIKADRMSMAPSLELRVPFLDHRLVEFAAQIPFRYKLRGKTTKYILKEMLRDLLPMEIIQRKKMGFPTPLKIMFQGELKEYAYDLLTPESALIGDYFEKREIERLLREHVKKARDNHRIIWQLVVLEAWLQSYNSGN